MNRNILFFLLFVGFYNSTISAQTQDKVNFERANISIEIDAEQKKISGTVDYKFNALSPVDSIFLDAKNMTFLSVKLNGRKAKYSNNGNQIIIQKNFKKGDTFSVALNYTAIPKQTVYFIGDTDTILGNEQIWTQGQGKYTSHWLPSFDDMNEKVEFDLNITFDSAYQVISNGKLIASKSNKNKTTTWFFDMEKPMSSYLLAFVIGNYAKNILVSESGIPIELYYYPNDSLKVEPTYRHTKKIFDFLEQEIGVPYPWQNYKQIPVKDFLYAGMENTTATIFSDDFMIDSTAFIDKNYVNVNAHELAHQWFGNMVTAVDGSHHWLQEGFATYYALLAEKEIFGADYFYWKLYDTAKQLKVMSQDNKGEALTDAKASSLTFYEKGAWALVMLRNELGDTAFKNGIKNYLTTYKYKNATIQNFLLEMEQASGEKLINFKSEWLLSSEFPITSATSFLKNYSESLAQYFDFQEKLKGILNTSEKSKHLQKIYAKTNNLSLKKQLITIYFALFPEEFIRNLLLSDQIEIRQAVILATDSIPITLKKEYESLLKDKSYSTVESVLYKLWVSFPDDQKKYLDITDGVIGFPNKNVRLIWLTLAIASQNYNGRKTKDYFDELSGYTNAKYSIETRQTAFTYLYQTLGLTDENLKDLVHVSNHHSWQFKKFARNLVDELVKDIDYKNRIKELVPTLNLEEQRYIKSKL